MEYVLIFREKNNKLVRFDQVLYKSEKEANDSIYWHIEHKYENAKHLHAIPYDSFIKIIDRR